MCWYQLKGISMLIKAYICLLIFSPHLVPSAYMLEQGCELYQREILFLPQWLP